jgi:cold shock CspA family protein
MTGRVVSFDESAGFGTVEASDGQEFFFHCTQLTNGTRTIGVGANVRFELAAGHLGRWEARHVEEQ